MKVILSIDSVRFPLTGIGRYTFELARHLPIVSGNLEINFMSDANIISELPVAVDNYPVELIKVAHESNPVALRKPLWRRVGGPAYRFLHRTAYGLARKIPGAGDYYRSQLSLRQSIKLQSYPDSIFHGPNFYLPPFSGSSVVTLHDLSVYKWAHCHPRERVKVLRKHIQLAIGRADMILTDSEFTRHEVSEFLDVPLERITAIPLASSEEFHPRVEADIKPTLDQLGLKYQRYTLFAGTIEPRKNISMLLDAYAALPEVLRMECPLVLCGYSGWKSGDVHRRIEQGLKEGWLKYPGFVSTEDLPRIYAGARLFVFPSHYEGFGLPVLEAMASGVPVICSDSSSLPEVAGSAALMFNTKEPEQLVDLLGKGLEDESWRDQASRDGLVQAARFSWQRCAQQTYDVYESLN